MREQLTPFDSLSFADQARLLASTVQQLDELPDLYERILSAYLERDLAAIMQLNEESQAKGDRELEERLWRELVDERNLRMVERMQPQLRRGRAFIAVGALHLPGEHGILQLLKNRGYRVDAVY